jgi:hypothetical protein
LKRESELLRTLTRRRLHQALSKQTGDHRRGRDKRFPEKRVGEGGAEGSKRVIPRRAAAHKQIRETKTFFSGALRRRLGWEGRDAVGPKTKPPLTPLTRKFAKPKPFFRVHCADDWGWEGRDAVGPNTKPPIPPLPLINSRELTIR